MTGITFFNRLSKKDRNLFEKNLKEGGFFTKEKYLTDDFINMHEFVCSAFCFDKTPEGFEYWDNIANVEK